MSTEPPADPAQERSPHPGGWDADDPDAWDEDGHPVEAQDAHARDARQRAQDSELISAEAAPEEAAIHDEDGHADYLDWESAEDPRATVADSRAQRRAGTRRRKRLLVYALALAIVAGGVGTAYAVVRPVYEHFVAAKDYPGPGSGAADVVVEPGATGREIGDELVEAGVLLSSGAFTDALADNPGDEIQPGHYTLRRQMRAADALSLMRSGRNVNRVTVREGLWKSEVFAELSKTTRVPLAEYTKAEAAIRKQPSLVGLPPSAKGQLEGYLFPATYEFDPGTSAVAQVREMVSHSLAQLRSLGVQPAEMEKTLTVASIVEAEARRDADRPRVARVIDNRLTQHMRLQLDSTVSYGVQRRSITTTDAERAANNPYNTYKRDGLPAGPIGNPGAESIQAAQRPAAGPWLFFVTINPDSGETRFGVTPAEHDVNVKLFQQWCQANPGKC